MPCAKTLLAPFHIRVDFAMNVTVTFACFVSAALFFPAIGCAYDENAAANGAVRGVLNDQPRDETDSEVVEIPLDRIRHGAPGSRQLRELEPEFFIYRDTPEAIAEYSTAEGITQLEAVRQRAAEESLVLAIEQAMAAMPMGADAQAGQGFAVAGSDRASLRGVYDVLVPGEPPQVEFSAEQEITLVFFALPASPIVRIERVERRASAIEIHYLLIPSGRPTATWNLALIPLGQLPPAEYRVVMTRSTEREQKALRWNMQPVATEVEQRIICQPFSFMVLQE